MKKYFFEPRVGSRYAEKWDGYYTMILGAHQVCTANCEFKSLCTTNAGVREMDNGWLLMSTKRITLGFNNKRYDRIHILHN